MQEEKTLSTKPYKGVRDFYPEDFAVLHYLKQKWSEAAELFGYVQYDASVLELSDLYKHKGQENEEIINEQSYTFTDRGNREVTLRPEMTPTAARMIAGKRNELNFPVRWYAIPNLFRYERPQRGRLREHWQLNCDLFGDESAYADAEVIALAVRMLKVFGATDDMFEVRINDRAWVEESFDSLSLSSEQKRAMFALLDRKEKISNFDEEAEKIIGAPFELDLATPPKDSRLAQVIELLLKMGITNVVVSPSTVRGFNYYTGVVFEIFDTHPDNNRALLGGGRYDNLTAMFGGEVIPGIGFGMGDVAMRDFLETHELLDAIKLIRTADISIIPLGKNETAEATRLAEEFRGKKIGVRVDFSERKLGKKIQNADDEHIRYVLVVGENELATRRFTLKELVTGAQTEGSIEEIITHIQS